MNKKAMINNAEGTIQGQSKAAAEGKDFSTGAIIGAERMKSVAKIDLTEEETQRLLDLYRQPGADWTKAKDIKEKYSLSWNELKSLSGSCESIRNKVKAIRARTGLSQAAFCAKYEIPKRTLESWESGDRECPNYVVNLLNRAVDQDFPS